jgi:hypothetical protein
MYFWKVDNLIEDLKSEKVTQKEEFKYMLYFAIATTLFSDPIFSVNISYNIYDLMRAGLYVTTTILGLYYCYKINSAGDNNDFMKRVICIGLPVTVRLFVIFTPISFLWGGIVYYVIQGNSVGDPLPEIHESNVYEVVYLALMLGVCWLYLSKKIKKISIA